MARNTFGKHPNIRCTDGSPSIHHSFLQDVKFLVLPPTLIYKSSDLTPVVLFIKILRSSDLARHFIVRTPPRTPRTMIASIAWKQLRISGNYLVGISKNVILRIPCPRMGTGHLPAPDNIFWYIASPSWPVVQTPHKTVQLPNHESSAPSFPSPKKLLWTFPSMQYPLKHLGDRYEKMFITKYDFYPDMGPRDTLGRVLSRRSTRRFQKGIGRCFILLKCKYGCRDRSFFTRCTVGDNVNLSQRPLEEVVPWRALRYSARTCKFGSSFAFIGGFSTFPAFSLPKKLVTELRERSTQQLKCLLPT